MYLAVEFVGSIPLACNRPFHHTGDRNQIGNQVPNKLLLMLHGIHINITCINTILTF